MEPDFITWRSSTRTTDDDAAGGRRNGNIAKALEKKIPGTIQFGCGGYLYPKYRRRVRYKIQEQTGGTNH